MEDFKIIPYARVDGVPTFKNSELAGFYNRLEEEGLADIVFHDGTVNSADDFVQMATSPRVLFYAILDARVGKPAGIFWCNRLERTHCHCHFAVFRDWHGSGETVAMGRMAMRHLLFMRDDTGTPIFCTIMGMLPASNRAARMYLRQVGFHDVGEVPNQLWSEKAHGPVDGFVMYITREDLKDEDL